MQLITVIIVISIVLTPAFIYSTVFEYVFLKLMVLSPDSMTFKMWLDLPVPIEIEFYFFNWTNADEFVKNPKIKPTFEEVGPFVYTEAHARAGIKWDDERGTLFFNQSKAWTFVPEKSLDNETEITSLNTFSVTLAYLTRYTDSIIFLRLLNVLLLRYESFALTAPVKDWLFHGVRNELLDKFLLLLDFVDIPVPYNKFGWFYDRNGSFSFEGRMEMKTGRDNLMNLGELVTWNGENRTKYFDDVCGNVMGSAGELMAPLGHPNQSVTTFSTDLCSYMSLSYAGQREVEGFLGSYYEGDASVFDDGTINQKNECFCSGECPPSGTRNVSTCKHGSPAFVSFPHFYLADPFYTESIEGMHPDGNKHSFKLTLDPETGIALEVRAQIQINMLVLPVEPYEFYKDKPKIYVPMLYFVQKAKMTPNLARLLKVYHFFKKFGAVLMFIIANFLILTAFLVTFSKNYRQSNLNRVLDTK